MTNLGAEGNLTLLLIPAGEEREARNFQESSPILTIKNGVGGAMGQYINGSSGDLWPGSALTLV